MVISAVPTIWTDGAQDLQEWLARQGVLLSSEDSGVRKNALAVIHQLSQDPRAQPPLLQKV